MIPARAAGWDRRRPLVATVPRAGPRYWAALCLASVAGANLGDFFAHDLGLGHWRGLPVLALLFAAVALAARRAPAREAWYWLGILIVRTAATNLSDLQIEDAGLPYPAVLAGFAASLAVLAILDRRLAPEGVPVAGGLFWLAMLAAGTLGTALGDDLAFGYGLHPPAASAWMTAVLAAALLARAAAPRAALATFWITVVVVRTWGTNVGDLVAHRLTLPVATFASTGLLVLLLLAWRPRVDER